MYAALDLGQKTIQAVLKRDDGKIVKEVKIKKQADLILQFLRGTNAAVVMESRYNYQHLYDLLKEERYNVKVAHPLMVKAIAYAKVKTDKVDARTLADLLRMDMVPECYIPEKEIRDLRDIARRRHYFVTVRTMFKNNVHAELSKRRIDYSADLFTEKGKEHLRSLKIAAVDDCLGTIDFLDRKIRQLDSEIRKMATDDRYEKHLMTIPGISYYAALLISGEIADINRFPSDDHLASYFGIVPANRDSSNVRRRGRMAKEGPAVARWTLSIMVDTVTKWNRPMRDYYLSVKNRTSSGSMAHASTMRKLVRMLCHMLKTRQRWKW